MNAYTEKRRKTLLDMLWEGNHPQDVRFADVNAMLELEVRAAYKRGFRDGARKVEQRNGRRT